MLILLCMAASIAALAALLRPDQSPGWSGYVAINKEAPMLALPGADLPQLRQALDELEKTSSVSVFPFSDDPGKTWHRNVHPIAFLRSAADAEDARRAMLRSGTKESITSYHEKLHSLLDAYDEALARTISGVGTGKPTTIASFKGTTSSAHVIEVLTKAKESLARMRAEEERRFDCASGEDPASCKQALWSSARPQTPPSPRSGPQTLPPEVEVIRTALRDYFERGEVAQRQTVALAASHCYPSYAPVYYDTSVRASEASGVPAAEFTLLSDAFFYDLQKIPVVFSQEYLKSGATYSYQPFNVYICQDSGYEMGNLLSVRHAHAYLTAHPIVAHSAASRAPLAAVLETQAAFLSETVPSQAAYLQFISALSSVLDKGDAYALSLFGTRQRTEDLRDLALEARTRSANLELIVGYFDNLQTSTYTTGAYDAYRTSVFYMLRSGVSPLLLLANETGPLGDSGSLFSSTAKTELAPTGYTLLSFSRDLSARHSLSALLSAHAAGHERVVAPKIEELLRLRAKI